MGASLQCTGPCHLGVWFPTGDYAGTWQYFGTCEKSPRWQTVAGWLPVYNDLGGQTIPMDQLFQGHHGFLSADMTRFDRKVLKSMMARPFYGLDQEGANGPADIGTMMVTEGQCLQVAVLFPFSTKAPMVAAGMPRGVRLLACTLESPEDFDTMGTAASKVRVIWHALRAYQVQSAGLGGGFKFSLYDNDVSSFPPVN